MAFGAAFTISGVMDFKMFTLVWVSSIRVWPGFLAIPEVIITISESLASSYSPAMMEDRIAEAGTLRDIHNLSLYFFSC